MGVLIGLVGLVLTLASLLVAMYFGVIGTKTSNRQEQQDRQDHDWQLKHEAVAVQLARINLTLQVRDPAHDHIIMLYPTLFPSPQLRQEIEIYIIEIVDNRTRFAPRRPTPHELRSPTLRRVVDQVTEALDACKRDAPALAYHFTGPG
jgi:hypothetical protein